LLLTFDLCVKGTRVFFFLFCFIWLLYGAVFSYIDLLVLDLSQNVLFDLWFLTSDFGIKVIFFLLLSFIWLLYGALFSEIDQAVQELLQNEIFDLWFWPLTLGSRSWKKFLLLYLSASMVQIWTQSVQSSPRNFTYSPARRRRTTTSTELWLYSIIVFY